MAAESVTYVPATRPSPIGFKPMVVVRINGRMAGSRIAWKTYSSQDAAMYWARLIATGANRRLAMKRRKLAA
ncbi:hypothetical protein ACJ4V0_15820 [Phreatobacter sp. HK31-P]